MLSKENNELICRVGRGTPMGNLMRQYWIPALPSREFPEAGAPPLRMRLLGENLVMFRDTLGRVGALEESCPHRGASLYFARNEEGGIRCAYHGWKFDVNGACLETPSEQPDKREKFRARIKANAYPCREVNKMVWIYMGPRETPPPFPEFEINLLPDAYVGEPQIMMEQANWLQNLEGDIDSAHLDWLHSRLKEDSEKPEVGMPGFWNPTGAPPILDTVTTEYGAYYSAKRKLPDGSEWHRINQFIFPLHTMITLGNGTVVLRSFVPVDDHHTMLISHPGHPCRPLTKAEEYPFGAHFEEVGGYVERTSDPRTYYLTKVNKDNDYGRSIEMQKDKMFLGVPFVGNLQDRCMTELMTNDEGEPLYDRTKEHLGSSDAMVVTVRRQLINAATRLRDENKVPENVDKVELDRVRCGTLKLKPGADWKSAAQPLLVVRENEPAASDLALIQ
jgi:nitrite reductase/ring-hydroxylating ferredoxin subunit